MFLSKIAIFCIFAVMVTNAKYLLVELEDAIRVRPNVRPAGSDVELEDAGSPMVPKPGLPKPGSRLSGASRLQKKAGSSRGGGKFLRFVVKINMIVDHVLLK